MITYESVPILLYLSRKPCGSPPLNPGTQATVTESWVTFKTEMETGGSGLLVTSSLILCAAKPIWLRAWQS